MESEILTESGTNEAEFLEFYLNDQSFAINVAKVIQIIPYDEQDLTRTAGGPESALGSILWRDHTVDLIDLCSALRYKEVESPTQPVVLVTNFNNITCGFRVKGVNRIHRVNWNDIQPMDTLMDRYSPKFTGSITIEENNILLVDFENLVSKMFAAENDMETQKTEGGESDAERRAGMNIVFAEDSGLIRNNLVQYMKTAGYEVHAHENGQTAWDYVNGLRNQLSEGGNITDMINLVVTDIEMPKMDGLTFCRKIKEDEQLSKIPVVIFSSMINEQMAVKCKEVGADDYLAKPRSKELVQKIDEILIT